MTTELRERLAEYSHAAWSQWVRYMFAGCNNSDGSVTIPAELVERWKRQMNIQYDALPEREKRSDRAEADKILDVCEKWREEAAREILKRMDT